MNHIKKFNEGYWGSFAPFSTPENQYYWVRYKKDGNPIIAGKEDGYWIFMGSDRILEDDDFQEHYEIIKPIEKAE